jgi:hypothetical protein
MHNFRNSKQSNNASARIFPLGLALAGLALILMLVMLAAACGSDKTAASTSTSAAVASETTQTSADSSTTTATEATSTITAQTSSTAATTTTTLKVTTTTAKATTTTAKATTTTKKTTTTKATTTTVKATTTTVKANAILTLVGPSGTKKLSMADLKAMSASSGYGGWKNQLGNITGPMSWKGVRVSALRDLVGGSGSVTVIASDGYEQTLSASVIAGDTNLYDPTTGDQISGGSVKAILAYSQSGSALSSSDGPLRIAFVSAEKDQVTDSAMWVKLVVKIKVN